MLCRTPDELREQFGIEAYDDAGKDCEIGPENQRERDERKNEGGGGGGGILYEL